MRVFSIILIWLMLSGCESAPNSFHNCDLKDFNYSKCLDYCALNYNYPERCVIKCELRHKAKLYR